MDLLYPVYPPPRASSLNLLLSGKAILANYFELSPGFLAMVRQQHFSGLICENPYLNLSEFELLCSCLKLEGVSQDTHKWKLFPLSLNVQAQQCYTVGRVNGDWETMWDRFCLAVFHYHVSPLHVQNLKKFMFQINIWLGNYQKFELSVTILDTIYSKKTC